MIGCNGVMCLIVLMWAHFIFGAFVFGRVK